MLASSGTTPSLLWVDQPAVATGYTRGGVAVDDETRRSWFAAWSTSRTTVARNVLLLDGQPIGTELTLLESPSAFLWSARANPAENGGHPTIVVAVSARVTPSVTVIRALLP